MRVQTSTSVHFLSLLSHSLPLLAFLSFTGIMSPLIQLGFGEQVNSTFNNVKNAHSLSL